MSVTARGLMLSVPLVAAVSLAVLAPVARTGAVELQPVALELVLAIDVSSSVSAAEFDLQKEGLSAAVRDAAVLGAIEALGDQGVAVAIVQWSGNRMQRVSVGWRLVRDAAGAERLAAAIEAMERLLTGSTALGGAIRHSLEQLETNGYDGRRKVIDVSADGYGGLSPSRERDRAVARGVTINGLAILNEKPELGSYFAAHVIGGPGAFLVTADTYQDFVDSMRDKLIKELAGPGIASAPAARHGRAAAASHRSRPEQARLAQNVDLTRRRPRRG